MAVSSTSSANSTTSIDVAGIVDSLMKAENIPLDTLKAKIAKEETVISDLGVIKGKVASFQSALDDMESIANFTTVSASSSDSDVVSATGVNGTIYGSYTVSDITLAKATVLSYKATSSANFSSTSDTVTLDNGEFTIQVGSAGTVYTIYGGLTGAEDTGSGSLTDVGTTFGPTTDFVAGTYENVLISGSNSGGAYGTIIVDGSGNYRVSEITSVGSGFQAGDELTISSSDIGGSDSESLTLGTLSDNGLEIDITELAYAINSLGIEVSASVTKTTSSSNYIFTIRGTETGADNEVAVTGLDNIYNYTSGSVTAVDASFKIDGTSFVRSSNTVSDVIDGVTFTLKAADATNDYTITVTEGADNASAKIQSLVTAYNDLIDSYKTLTANSYNSSSGTTGTFASNPTMLYFINEIKARFAKGFSYDDGTYTVSLSSLGIDLAKDGSATFNATTFATTQADGIKERDMTITSSFVYNTRTLQSILAGGMKMGYVDSSDYLNSYIDGLIGVTGSGGLLADTVINESDALDDLYDKQIDLEDRLTTIQNNYITQYSALNTLLYQLSVTSNSLTSALDALNNNNN